MADAIGMWFPRLAARLPKIALATLPTPLEQHRLDSTPTPVALLVKRDDLSSALYGGNKVRKLEYLLRRAQERGAQRVATFGTVASNHALATSIHAQQLRLACTCFLSHQGKTPKAPLALNMHLRLHTEIVRFGGDRASRVATLRAHLRKRRTWVIPMGGSSWLGVVGFVNAALELAAQLEAQRLTPPARLYVANGTMGTAAGLAIGLALAGLDTEIQAVRVTHAAVANPVAMQRLIDKTVMMMHRLDATVPASAGARVRLCFRDEFFAGGYARSDAATEHAIEVADRELGLVLDSTYSGKAMAAMLSDARRAELAEQRPLFWNTYNSSALPVTPGQPGDTAGLPEEFLRYYV